MLADCGSIDRTPNLRAMFEAELASFAYVYAVVHFQARHSVTLPLRSRLIISAALCQQLGITVLVQSLMAMRGWDMVD
jgi:hypothetical protein